MLGGEDIYYEVPLVLVPDKIVPKRKFRDFLCQQLDSDLGGVTACLIIHALTKHSD